MKNYSNYRCYYGRTFQYKDRAVEDKDVYLMESALVLQPGKEDKELQRKRASTKLKRFHLSVIIIFIKRDRGGDADAKY